MPLSVDKELRSPELQHTFRRHVGYALLGAMGTGISANAPLMAVKAMGAPGWQLSFQLTISSIGMFLMLYLGDAMATRRKKPFVVVPGYAAALATLAMGLTSDVLIFLVLFGLATLFESITRPAVTAVIRANYPATHRGAVTGTIRKWSSLLFMAANLASSVALRLMAPGQDWMIAALLTLAAAAYLGSYLCFRSIRVLEHKVRGRGSERGQLAKTLRRVSRDGRFLRYLAIGFLYAFGALLYVALIPVFLGRQLGFGYVECAVLIHIIPGSMAFLTTGRLGRWFDRINPWKAWAAIRLGWGLDPLLLALTVPVASFFPLATGVLPTLGRVSRGAVQGGSWILWWQVGINHFAPPGQDTTRYMSLQVFVNGLARLLAPLAGAWLYERGSAEVLFVTGGVLVLSSGALALIEYRREQRKADLATMAAFEQARSRDK